MVFTASLLRAQHKSNSVESKPESSLVMSLGKTLNDWDSFVPLAFMWQTDNGAKQSTRRGGPVKLKTSKKG